MVHSLLEKYFDEYLKLYPSLASSIGEKNFDDQYENDLSTKHNRKFISLQNKYLKQVNKITNKNIENMTLYWILNDNINGNK